MTSTALTVLNPQHIAVDAVVALPGKPTESKQLAPGEQWVITNGNTTGQWIAFFNPQTSALLAAAQLPDNSDVAQLLLSLGISGVLRMNAAPLTVTNQLTTVVQVQVQDVGARQAALVPLNAAGHAGSSRSFRYVERGQWVEFYSADGQFITGSGANGFSLVSLDQPAQTFVIGNPYPVGVAAAEDGTMQPTLPEVEG